MPFRRRNFPGRRRGRRRGITYRQIGSKVWRDLKWLKSVVNVERKYLDANASSAISNVATFVLLNGLSLGTSSTTRNGQSIKMTSFTFNAWSNINTSATRTLVRFLIVKDRQPNAATPAITDILVSSSVTSLMNIGNGHRFKLMMDKRVTLSINGIENSQFHKFRKLKFHTEYNAANAGDITDITTNSFYLIMLSNEATNTPTVSYSIRVRWIDN